MYRMWLHRLHDGKPIEYLQQISSKNSTLILLGLEMQYVYHMVAWHDVGNVST